MSTEPPRVELYVRSLAPTTARPTQERVVERLQALEESGEVTGFDVVVCGECVCPNAATASTEPGERLLSRYDSFEAWAEANDRTLVGFQRRDTRSVLTDTTVTGIVFPRVTLAEYRDGTLSFVAPSGTETERTAVLDRLAEY